MNKTGVEMERFWRTSSLCMNSGCVEFGIGDDGKARLRDNKVTGGQVLKLTLTEWDQFLDWVTRSSEVDEPCTEYSDSGQEGSLLDHLQLEDKVFVKVLTNDGKVAYAFTGKGDGTPEHNVPQLYDCREIGAFVLGAKNGECTSGAMQMPAAA
jgi:hypothetical protein